MDKRAKNNLYSVVLLAVVGIVFLIRECSTDSTPPAATGYDIKGTTFGTVPYQIKYLDSQAQNLQTEIQELLNDFNQSLSTYVPDSEISRFNKGDTLYFETDYFYPVLVASQQVFQATGGAFDPSVQPLVRAWGFGPDKQDFRKRSSVPTDSLLQFIGFDKIKFDNEKVWKTQAGVELDFGAVAKGYAVDLIAKLLEEKGIFNYMVEIGGEVRCNGTNNSGSAWKIGVNNPEYAEKGGNAASMIIALRNRSLATSGNYRNFYERDGKRYAHTLSPVTGEPVTHSLLSASVVAPNCMLADAYATAFMVLGVEKAKEIAQQQGLELVLIYADGEGTATYTSAGVEAAKVQ